MRLCILQLLSPNPASLCNTLAGSLHSGPVVCSALFYHGAFLYASAQKSLFISHPGSLFHSLISFLSFRCHPDHAFFSGNSSLLCLEYLLHSIFNFIFVMIYFCLFHQNIKLHENKDGIGFCSSCVLNIQLNTQYVVDTQ